MEGIHPQEKEEFFSRIDISSDQLKVLEQILGKSPSTGDLLFLSQLKKSSSAINVDSPIIAHALKPSNKVVQENGHQYFNLGNDVFLSLAISTSGKTYPFFPYQKSVDLFYKSFQQLLAKQLEPLVSINALRIGNTKRAEVNHLFQQSLSAISDTSNFSGIPALGGEFFFDDSFNQSSLSNVLTLGIGKQSTIENKVSAKAGDPVLYLSPLDQHPSLSRAAEEETNAAGEALIPDHFYRQNILALHAACQEQGIYLQFASCLGVGKNVALFNLIKGLPLGLEVDWSVLNLEENITADIGDQTSDDGFFLSIAQEDLNPIQLLADRFNMQLIRLGQLLEEERLIIRDSDRVIVDLPKRAIDQEALFPALLKNPRKPSYVDKANKFSYKKMKHQKDYEKNGQKIFESPNIIARRGAMEYFNCIQGIENLSYNLPSDAAVFQVPEINKTLALTVTGNPKYIKSDPYLGTMMAISEAARGIINSGGKPLAFSIGLNFGDVGNSSVQWQLQQCLRGIAEAAKKYRLALIEVETNFGNQNIHNKGTSPILPSPVIGMLGSLDRPEDLIGIGFKEAGDLIYMIGTPHNDINASTFLAELFNGPATPSPIFDLDEEYHIMINIRKLIQKDLLVSAHKIAEGGLFKALLDCTRVDDYGFVIETDTNFRKDAYLFGEAQGRSIVTTKADREDELVNFLNSQNVPFSRLGEVRGDEIIIDNDSLGSLKKWDGSKFKALVD